MPGAVVVMEIVVVVAVAMTVVVSEWGGGPGQAFEEMPVRSP